jgi:hypothetical protein
LAAFWWKNDMATDDQLGRRKVISVTALVLVVFSCLFVLLRSSNIFEVDGASCCLGVFRRQTLFFHGNNHMLYPVNVLVWNRVVGAVSFRPNGAEEFYALTQWMNCLAGAGCLAIVFYLLYLVTSSVRLAFGVVLAYGLSRAFLLHATNAAEPLAGVFWSLLAMCFAALSLKRKSNWPIIVSALLFSLAMSTYQSTIFLAPSALVLIWQGRSNRDDRRFLTPARIAAVCEFTLAGIAGCAAIFGWAYWRQGFRHPAEIVGHFFTHDDAKVYLGVSVGKIVTVPIGMVRNIFPLVPHFVGLRELLTGPKLSPILLVLVIGILCAFLVVCARRLTVKWKDLSTEVRVGVMAATVGFAFTIIPVIIWDPSYDKLWLQPLACLAFFIGMALKPISMDVRYGFLISRAFSVLFLAGVSLNLVWAVRDHETKLPDLEETQRLARLIEKQDLVVGGWDSISTLYGYGWADDGQLISFPTEAVLHGYGSVANLRDAISEAERRGGRVYFLSLLDVPQASWDSFLGSRCGVPYSVMGSYRAHSRIRATFYEQSSQVFLRQLELTVSN